MTEFSLKQSPIDYRESNIMSRVLSIDFTGCLSGWKHYSSFGDEVVGFIRGELPAKSLLVVDYAYGLPKAEISLVSDHLNLTGSNPLIGPNNPCGERFPRVTDVYMTELFDKLPTVITAGLKQGIEPSAEEVSAIKAVGGQCWSYNLVPTMIIAAHAGLKVLGILLPAKAADKAKWEADLRFLLQSETGDN